MNRDKWIIDTDPGLDDFCTILYLLKHPKAEVLMLSLTAGNGSKENVIRNAKRAAFLAKSEVPLHFGASQPIVKGSESAEYYHGVDGLGDQEITKEFDKHDIQLQEENSVTRMVDLINEYPGEISLLVIGPESNVALAYMMDPSIAQKVKRVVIMGGSYASRGNLMPNTEFNFGFDFIACHIVIEKFNNCVICPWEPVEEVHIMPEDFEEMVEGEENLDERLVEFFRGITVRYLEKFGGIELCDFYAIASIYNTGIVTDYKVAMCSTVIDSAEQRGMLYFKDILKDSGDDFGTELEEIAKRKDKYSLVMTKFDKKNILKELVSCFKKVS